MSEKGMNEKDQKDIKQAVRMVERAMSLCDKFVPVNDRNPTPGGGNVRTMAVGILVAARACLEALVEEHEIA